MVSQFLYKLKGPSARKKNEKRRRDRKKRASTHTHNKDIERRKKRGTDRESNIKQRRNLQHRFVYGISSILFFSESLSPSFSNLNFCLVMQIGSGFMGSS